LDEPESKGEKPMSSLAKRQDGRGRNPSPDAAFDLWLQRGLHQMFDDVAREPIPPELLALIEADRNKE